MGGDSYYGATHGEGVELEDETADGTGFLQKVKAAVVHIDIEDLLAFVFKALYPGYVFPMEHEVAFYAHIIDLKKIGGDHDNGAVGDGTPQISEGLKPDDVQYD